MWCSAQVCMNYPSVFPISVQACISRAWSESKHRDVMSIIGIWLRTNINENCWWQRNNYFCPIILGCGERRFCTFLCQRWWIIFLCTTDIILILIDRLFLIFIFFMGPDSIIIAKFTLLPEFTYITWGMTSEATWSLSFSVRSSLSLLAHLYHEKCSEDQVMTI